MRKLGLIAAMLTVCILTASAKDTATIKLSLFDEIAWPKVEHVKGVELGLLYSNTPKVTGLQWTFMFYNKTEDLSGVQLSLVNSADNARGFQWGAVNMAKDMSGFQWGLVNYAESFKGFQLGFVNYVEEMRSGLQIGLVNIIRNSKLPVMIIANAKF